MDIGKKPTGTQSKLSPFCLLIACPVQWLLALAL